MSRCFMFFCLVLIIFAALFLKAGSLERVHDHVTDFLKDLWRWLQKLLSMGSKGGKAGS